MTSVQNPFDQITSFFFQAEDFYSLNADVKAAGDAATEAARNGRDFPDVEGLASERGGRRTQG